MSIDPVTARPDRAICQLLDASVAPGLNLQLGQSLFVGPARAMTVDASLPPQVPPRAVFVLVAGGGTPETAHDGTVWHDAQVEIFVRASRGDFEGGQDLARGVWATVHNQRPANYQTLDCLESEPRYMGTTEDHPQWLINVRAQYWS